MKKKKAWIALGSNIGDSKGYIEKALHLMKERGVEVLTCSELIVTKPYGGVEQDDFLNGLCMVETLKSPHDLLMTLLEIERELDRVREIKWGPRTIDLDIIYYEDEVISTGDLIIPHPEMQKRHFVLEPLCEISPNFIHPVLKKTSSELLFDLNLKEELEWLESRERFGMKLGLDSTYRMLDLLDNPQEDLKVLHVAGTNGKGSTCAYLSSVLEEAGYDVGLFTSPFIESFNERFQINHQEIKNKDLLEIIQKVKRVVYSFEQEGIFPTYFEILTVMAFLYFYQKKVDFVVLEVGLGGLYDSTNVVSKPIASIITTIDYDHTDILGDSLEEIAFQKAGIIKEDSLVFVGINPVEVQDVLKNVAGDKKSPIYFLREDAIKLKETTIEQTVFDYKDFQDIRLSLLGRYQAKNASLALLTLSKLKKEKIIKFTDEDLYSGFLKAKLPARLEVLSSKPYLILDGAHNLQAAHSLSSVIKDFDYNRLILGIGILKDKNYKDFIKLLVPLADEVVLTQLDMPRALNVEGLSAEVKKYHAEVVEEISPEKALEKSLALANEKDIVLWTGSLYLAGVLRKAYHKRKGNEGAKA